MAKGPRTIDLVRFPHSVKEWDVIGIQSIPRDKQQIIVGSSDTAISRFKASTEKPSMRAIVCKIVYDTQNDDAVAGVIVMPLAPYRRDKTRTPNNPKNLMFSNPSHLAPMGLDPALNWRLNYTPFYLETDKPNFGTPVNMLIKFGSAQTQAGLIMTQIEKLEQTGELNTMGILDGATKRVARGIDSNLKYDGHFVGGEAHTTRDRFVGRTEDQKILEYTENKRREEEQAKKRETAKEDQQKQKATPSGRLALQCQVSFNDAANVDISLENAHTLKLINVDQWIAFTTIGEKHDALTLRTLYDLFRDNHEQVQTDLIEAELCNTQNVIEHKAALEQGLKDSLISYFRTLKNNSDDNKARQQDYQQNSTGYAPRLTL